MTPHTATVLGTLDTSAEEGLARINCYQLHDDGADDGDGLYCYWMTPGDTYGVVHDGGTWTVAGGVWTEVGHTYRLVDDGGPMESLPTRLGPLPLDPGRGYQLQVDEAGDWLVWRLG
ncbi:hypothetical protein Lfu02_16230 [Longispora fulva]|uniref:Uncharacterized protein n=1 Tax=Longispora fulva TaxID=619741 RepID=A0A8J7H1Q8_9ACTN|nr:hypothetical protein [Longispora fulva]MBG6140368.1 hypothetical protein [Longispora fulva]GIG57251.1 hypothetical protein Lfu02_16230 [Longispora fulva]